jgi:excisionase family DNA binding protein
MNKQKYMTAEEVAQYMRSTLGSIRVMTSRKQIPHIKRGSRVLYDLDEIDVWLDKQRVPVAR